MKFTRLRLLGFKSFVEPMDFYIGPGLNGVVGPNGCGKSNLVEAIRWVMGENSYKNMRASGMDDVIFAGSNHRPARNSAEVTLYLNNSDRTAPAAFNDSDELEVIRRIEREAGSIYRINGKDVRARDVQLLFADASTGARSPAMVGQGRIGEIISQKPTQRRTLLEEAAGISGLHSRRHEAELRLNAAETNLDRLEDIMAQIGVQLDGLKRQARQASRYRNLSADIRKTEATLYFLRLNEACAREKEGDEALKAADGVVADATLAQSAAARQEAISNQALPALRDEHGLRMASLQRLRLAVRDLEAEQKRIAEKSADLTRARKQLVEDREREERLLLDNDNALERLEAEQKRLVQEEESAATNTGKAQEKQAILEADLGAKEKHLNELTSNLAGQEAQKRQLSEARKNTEARKSRLSTQKSEAQKNLASLEQSLKADSGLDAIEAEIEMAEKALSDCEKESEALTKALASAREQENKARRARADAESQFNRLDAEARTLRGIVNAGRDANYPPVLDALKVEPGFEKALAAALGDDLDAPMDSRAAIYWGEGADAFTDEPLPLGLDALSAHLEAPERLKRRLSQIGIVNEAHGANIQKQLKSGQRIVSLKGDLWRWDGLVAKAGAPTAAAQRLEQRNRLDALQETLEAVKSDLVSTRSAFENWRKETQALAAREDIMRKAWREAQKKLSQHKEALSRAQQKANALELRKTALAETIARLAQEEQEAQTAFTALQEQWKDLPDLTLLEKERDEARTILAEHRSALAEARAHFSGLKRDSELRKSRLASLDQEQKSWRERAQNAQKQLAVLDERLAKNIETQKALEENPDQISQQRHVLLSEIEKAEKLEKEAADKLANAERDAIAASLAAKRALEALSEAREARIRTEERKEAMSARRKDLEQRIFEALDCQPKDLPKLAHLSDSAPLPVLQGVETRLERLKAERERLGGVNLRADDEARDVAQKLEEMVSERDDLLEAIKKLRQGIFNLNKEARGRLIASFDQVNDHFKALFTKLFGGGEAELKLTEAEDPLHAGLDIIARPPGKKPQTMTLLSGGEQALTAMSLIFAVFLTNPAPICVLDEVDAALDDANVERFCTLLEEMRALTETRFIAITHNPITMARMDRLFGVTMAERGISQLVSVSLEVAEEMVAEEEKDKGAIASVPPSHPQLRGQED